MDKEIKEIVKRFFDVEVEVMTEVPEPQFGDVSTNVAMQLAGRLQKNPREVAEVICEQLNSVDAVKHVDIAGPGFINITLTDEQLVSDMSLELTKPLEGKTYVVEYSCPNWFKELHTGHLYQTVVGDSLSRMLQAAGASVTRASFGGDVGLHVAKAMWSILQDTDGYNSATEEQNPQKKAEFITSHYVAGSKAYEDDDTAKDDIRALNKRIYGFNKGEDTDSDEARVYFACREWGTEYFKYFYELIDVAPFDVYYPESTTEETGVAVVEEGLSQGVFTESDGAVVYEGEKVDLHTRVFMTREGLPTYEAKDLGVILLENEAYSFDHRVLMTGSDQRDYMKVVWAAMDELRPGMRDKMTHLVHGIVKFADGSKMSSRLGNVARAIDVVDAVTAQITEGDSELVREIALGAIKYEFNKYAVGGDIAFDIESSVSTKGNSGPYLQYAYARSASILRSTEGTPSSLAGYEFNDNERLLARKLGQFQSVFEQAVKELQPNKICTYLYELAQEFNRFYEKEKVLVGGEEQKARVQLVLSYNKTLKKGLGLLGIHAPEQM